MDGMANGSVYEFRMRSVGMGRESEWTETLACEVGPVETAGILSSVSGINLKTVLKTLYFINVHLLTTPP